MADHTTDIEKAPEGKGSSLDVAGQHGLHYYDDGVPRSKGVLGKARLPHTSQLVGLLTLSTAMEYC